MALSTDDVRDIARLARIAISDDEVERMRDQLSSILDHFEVLSDIDTDDVPPTAQSFDLTNVERPDEPAWGCRGRTAEPNSRGNRSVCVRR